MTKRGHTRVDPRFEVLAVKLVFVFVQLAGSRLISKVDLEIVEVGFHRLTATAQPIAPVKRLDLEARRKEVGGRPEHQTHAAGRHDAREIQISGMQTLRGLLFEDMELSAGEEVADVDATAASTAMPSRRTASRIARA